MSRRQLFLCLGLVAIIAAGLTAVRKIRREQELRAAALAGVPPIPDLGRWPPELARRIREESAAVAADPAPRTPLAELAGLYCANGFTAEGEIVLAALRRLEPANARWPYLLADLETRAGRNAAALPALLDTVALDPAYVPAWWRLGERQLDERNFAAARQSFDHAAALAPENLRVRFDRISTDAQQGLPGALDRLRELVREHPGINQLHALLADALAAAGDQQESGRQRRLAGASTTFLESADPWLDELMGRCFDSNRLVLRALAMGWEGRLAEQETLLQRLLQLSPQVPPDPLAWNMLAQLYLKMKRPDEARATLEKGVAQFPDEPRLPILLAQLLSTLQKPDDAVAVMTRAAQRWPARGDIQAALGTALREAGKSREAVPALREALRLDPTQTEGYYNLGCALLELGQRGAARDAIEQALARRPDYPEALFAVGGIDLEAGDAKAAEPYVTRFYALHPEEPNARYLFAALQLLQGKAADQAGDADTAEKLFRAGLAVSPDFGALLRETGALEIRRGRWDEAVKTLAHGISVEPGEAEGYYLEGLALQKCDRSAEARTVLERGLAVARQAGDADAVRKISEILGR